jgi:hypothetical protein
MLHPTMRETLRCPTLTFTSMRSRVRPAKSNVTPRNQWLRWHTRVFDAEAASCATVLVDAVDAQAVAVALVCTTVASRSLRGSAGVALAALTARLEARFRDRTIGYRRAATGSAVPRVSTRRRSCASARRRATGSAERRAAGSAERRASGSAERRATGSAGRRATGAAERRSASSTRRPSARARSSGSALRSSAGASVRAARARVGIRARIVVVRNERSAPSERERRNETREQPHGTSMRQMTGRSQTQA